MFINVSLDYIQIMLFSALSGISVFMFLYSILDIGIGRKKLSNKLRKKEPRALSPNRYTAPTHPKEVVIG